MAFGIRATYQNFLSVSLILPRAWSVPVEPLVIVALPVPSLVMTYVVLRPGICGRAWRGSCQNKGE